MPVMLPTEWTLRSRTSLFRQVSWVVFAGTLRQVDEQHPQKDHARDHAYRDYELPRLMLDRSLDQPPFVYEAALQSWGRSSWNSLLGRSFSGLRGRGSTY